MLSLGGGMAVESFVENWGSRVFIGCRGGTSMMFSDPKDLCRFLKLPPKTPSREKFDEWLATLEPTNTPAAPS
jgi:hypothetical protein